MGGLVADINVAGLFEQLNLRFGPNEAITEMLALHKEFDLFSKKHSLRESFALLNLGPANNWSHRRGWYKYLDLLKTYPSDKDGQSAHDRLVSVLRNHLGKGKPVPIHFTSHDTSKKKSLKVSSKPERALPYSKVEFLVVSLPMTPVEKDRAKRRGKSR